ncbi:CTP synthetase [Thalassobius vesicularis]|uniref:CTP synthetase n=1 Tax=Thalassobius vesicularis TaxID=1294297 RepID=A0A4S3M6L6_9RHOB|nr:CTP synthetase [Thalassobius vesicularis]THD72799.1 CTP synthetase [Thalassobius vesicularis]
MLRLASILYSLISTTLAGTLVIVALTMGFDTLQPILVAAAIGFAAALPVAWLVAKGIVENN